MRVDVFCILFAMYLYLFSNSEITILLQTMMQMMKCLIKWLTTVQQYRSWILLRHQPVIVIILPFG